MAHSYFYNLHNLTTVRSNVHLPELKAFLCTEEQPGAQANIEVTVGPVKATPQPPNAQAGRRYIQYREGWGPFGFNAEIDIQSPTRILVRATPVLRFSPHVLYTNLVEPILRWNFVEKGYALVHGACIAHGDAAYMVTARTDTGKTTTILRILDQQRSQQPENANGAAFISDDLTLVTPDGAVFAYPKPLTISYHTVAAVNSPYLSRLERLTLPLQSRIHSRSGRRLALWLTQSKLPMATINTYIQLLVPPPKYHVDQLVPGVKVTNRARLAGLFIIERGGQGEQRLPNDEAMEILLRNCDDAYGFPPYNHIEGFLRQVNGSDLRDHERTIVTQAFSGLPSTLLRSSNLDWAQRIPRLMTPLTTAFQPSVGLAMAAD